LQRWPGVGLHFHRAALNHPGAAIFTHVYVICCVPGVLDVPLRFPKLHLSEWFACEVDEGGPHSEGGPHCVS
ncbi:Hypothetical predicted protein, partial [Marmota monax]